MNDRKLFIDVAKGMALLLLVLVICGKTMGVGAILVTCTAFALAINGRIGWAIIGYSLFPLMVVINPFVVPKNGITGLVLRLGPAFLMIGLLISSASRSGRHQIPLGMMWLYLFVAGVCSMGGYYPTISYLKIVNCLTLFVGVQLGFRNIDSRPIDVMLVRKFLIVVSVFIVFGSVFVWVFFPGAAYMTTFSQVIQQEGMDAAAALARESAGLKLFAGIANQSQTLAVVLPCSLAWLMCDMFFIEKRISKLHVLTLLMGLPLIYMTRSRSGMLTSAVATVLIYFYCLGKVHIREHVRAKLRMTMTLGLIGVVVLAVIMEARNQSITKWIRKREDVAADERGLGEAFTNSRQGKIEENLADFRRNPLFGSGFQVTADMKHRFRHSNGLILSASLEKSILPLMILGETGIVGGVAFLIFLISFYVTCIKKKYYCCATLHTVFLATNMAEASYFSPGGDGGYLWVLTVGGGFIIDTVVLYHRRLARIARRQEIEWMMGQQYGGR